MADVLAWPDRAARTSHALALTFAWRELRGGIAGFRLFLACLALGVAIVAAVGSLSASLEAGIAADATRLLGGDLELRRVYRPLEPETLSFLQARGATSTLVETRSMVRPVTGDAPPLLVELKAVDAPYPMVGQVQLDPPQTLAAALASREGARGGVADPALFDRLNVRIGDRIALGAETFILTARLVSEPDRGATVFSLGPRLMIGEDALPATGLLVPGSLVYYETRLALSPQAGIGAEALAKAVRAEFPNSDFRVRTPADAGPGIKSFARRAALFLNFVGLAALLIGGVGVANAVGAYLEGRRATIATLKCLGASAGLVARVYLALVLGLAAGGVAIGLAAGAAAPFIAAPFLAAHFSVPFRAAIHALPLAEAAALGLLAALAFAFLPLARARRVPAAELFRATAPRSIDLKDRLWLSGICLLLAALAVLVSADRLLGPGFVIAAALCYLLFRVLAQGLARAARHLARRQQGHPALRLALANLARPGAPTTSVVLSLGLGLTVLVVVILAQGSLHRQIMQTLPAQAPSFYFIDIQQDQAEPFRALVSHYQGVSAYRQVPMLRGRIAAVNGVAADQLDVPKDQQWVLQGDRGLTWSDTLPEGSKLVEGQWWPSDYQGPPLVSFEAEAAAALGLKPGDHITISVLGREIGAEVANIRQIRWTDLTINFVMVFSPGSFAGAPATWLATASLPPEREAMLAHDVGETFPNVSTIRVKEALAAVDGLLSAVGAAIAATAGLALASGLLVLASAVLAEERRRIYEAVVLKVLGATRRDLARAFLMEQGLLGLVTGLLAILLGSIASWVLVTYAMDSEWSFSAPAAIAIALGGAALALLIGLGGTWRALSTPAAPQLRNE
ncbi:glycosyl transferase family 1 [Hypericibacter adhaerens]|uniref:Glycosyl transferase family 1 n=1 Tax=Hypericibacter adhaerens TaxID=2602016 RepID=A0A5J6N7Y6_9PROT|nr:FtsX-like permease family protein [Hypericibacter adhaerens]QEX24990.1 glycosyl transferase family 1 [Hypericibacter adhaerens]